jgi:LysR family hydrogen peroxide-inducible transcriptional activator
MTLQQLEYIVALDSYRNFVTAAEKCFITQPTLSMQVKKLEEEIGIQLFDRTKKPLIPTIAGETIIIKARQIIREVKQLKEYVSEEKESLKGTYRIGIIPTLAPYLLPLILPGFMNQNPETRLQIQEIQSKDIIDGLKMDTLDIGILSTPLFEKSLREIALFNEPFLLYLPKHHPYKSADKMDARTITTENILLLNEGHCFREQTLNVCAKNKKYHTYNFDFESGSLEALKRMVRMDLGYTLIPELAIQKEIDPPYIKRFKKPEPTREISLAVHQSFAKEQLIVRLRQSILEHIPDRFFKNNQYIKVNWR